ncbi:MAG: chitobiase/beta-hexosaminidase C-terminal domain-containing protein, partial [Bacteroidales bacterium]
MKRTLLLLFFALGLGYLGWGQQVIGSFPSMDGGFENQSSITVLSSIGNGVESLVWTVNNASGVATLNTTSGRSGPKYVTYSATASRRLQSPTAANQAIANTTAYTVQYYYKSTATPANGQVGVSSSGTGSPGTYVSTSLTNTSSVWTKVQTSATSGNYASTPRYGIGIIRFSGASTTSIDIDDFVLYAGAADNTTPDSPGAVTVANATSNSLDVSWIATGTGVDGGGYVVIRYLSNPNADNDPNQNGIYTIGNTTTNGTGSLVGTIRYVGTAISFTDTELQPNTQYWYKVYTVDKAFNYSTESSGNGTTSGGAPTADTPTFNPLGGNYLSTQNITISCATAGSTIYYSTNGTDPDNTSTEYTSPVEISNTTTLKAIAYATGYNPSLVATAIYTFPTQVSNIAALRAGATDGTRYKLTGEAILTYKTTSRNQKYIQDVSGAIMIDDNAGIITTSYNVYDGITGITGTLTTFAGMLEFVPVADPGVATSIGNTLTPEVKTIGNLTSTDQAKLVKLLNVTITGTGNFATATDYVINDNSKSTGVLRTAYPDLNYIGQGIPSLPQDLTGVVLQSTTTKFVPRSTADFVTADVPWPITFYVDMSGAGTYTGVQIAGDFNGWSGTAMSLVSGNIYSYTTASTFNVSDVLSFKFQKIDGDVVWENDPNRSYTVVAGTNEYHAVWNVMIPAVISWANIQHPGSGTIAVGGDYNVYSQVYAEGITSNAGATPNLECSIGYSTENTNPSTWTNWVTSNFNVQSGNNDEFVTNIGTAIPSAGTYYYASRFKLGFNDYVYGGYSAAKSGGFWNGTSNTSGILTITATEPSNHVTGFTATANSSSTITVAWTDAIADGYLIKGSTVSYSDITAPTDGIAVADGGLVKNIASGTGTYLFTGLTASTQYYFKIFPYNGAIGGINYKTDGSVPEATATTSETSATPIFIINELDADTPGADIAEFIELYDGGIGSSDLSGLVVVLYNGSNDLSYAAYDLDGFSTDANGYFVIGNTGVAGVDITFASNFLQNGADAVALYQANGTDFPNGAALTMTGLLDALVYDTDDADDAGLLTLLNAGQSQINENSNLNMANHSLQRLPNGTGGLRNTATYNLTIPTPSAENNYANYTWTGNTSNDWSVTTNWSGLVVPDAGANVAVTDVTNQPIVTSLSRCRNITIDAGANLEIGALGQLTVSGTITNNAGPTGLLIRSNATGTGSLLHNSSAINATIERYITGSSNLSANMYHFVSVPLEASNNPQAGLFTGSYLSYFDQPTQSYLSASGSGTTTPLDVTRGYMIYYPNTSTTYSFAGTMNNGSFTANTSHYSVFIDPNTYTGFNLVPNPYPSAIDWNASSGWTKTLINDAIWIWNPTTGNYAAYGSQAGTNGGTRYIPQGQSFFIQSSNTSPVLAMNNSVRVHNTQAFYKSTEATLPELLRVKVDCEAGTSDEIIVRFNSMASIEKGFYDVAKLTGSESAPQLYTLTASDERLSINALPHSTQTIVVPVGIEYPESKSLTFNASGFESFESSVTIFLEDKLLNKTIDLRENPVYTFTNDAGADPMRFNLLFYGVNSRNELSAANHNIWVNNDKINILVPELIG